MTRLGILFILLSQILLGCQKQPDFRVITTSFVNSARTSSVSSITLVPIDVGSSVAKLSKSIIITNSEANKAILTNIIFLEVPRLPKGMGHAGQVAACNMLVQFTNGTTFCFYLSFREGPVGAGIEYAINPDLNLDSVFDNRLPGNHRLGRGYSQDMYYIIQSIIKGYGRRWINSGRSIFGPRYDVRAVTDYRAWTVDRI